MASLTFHILFSIIPCILAVQVHPVARAVTSEANCTSTADFGWMFDTQGQSPCLVAAYVEAACVGLTYDQPVLKVGYSYALPNSTTSNQCYCSWSAYNLLMACTLCQGTSNFSTSVWPWATWSDSCTNSSWTDVYFPSGHQLSGGASIPYWATKNPANWLNGLFNVPDAFNAHNQNSSDVTPVGASSTSSTSSTSSSKSTDLGAIVGGTVGGAAALALLAVGAYLLYRRHVFKEGAYASVVNRMGFIGGDNGASTRMTHSRFPSDTSTQFAPGHSMSPLQQYSVYSPQPQTVYPSMQGSFSPPPRTDTSIYTTRGSQPSNAIPLV